MSNQERPPLKFYKLFHRRLAFAYRRSSDGLWTLNGKIKHFYFGTMKSDRGDIVGLKAIILSYSFWLGFYRG